MTKKNQQPEQQPEQPRDIREMTADTVGLDLLQALLAEIKLLPKPWASLPKSKQDDVIDRLRARVETNVKMAVHLIASDNRTVVVGDLEQVASKDGIKAQFKISPNSEGRHHLFDSVGHACLIVIAGAEDDQRAIDLGHEYHDNDGGGMDDDNIVDAEITTIEQQPLQAELDEANIAGYEAADDGLGQDACPVMDRRLCIEWIKGWKAWHEKHDQPADKTEGATERPSPSPPTRSPGRKVRRSTA